VLEALLPLMERLLDQSVDDMPEIDSKCLNLLVQRFTLETSDCLSKTSKGLVLFTKTLKLHQEVSENNQTSQMIAVSQVCSYLIIQIIQVIYKVKNIELVSLSHKYQILLKLLKTFNLIKPILNFQLLQEIVWYRKHGLIKIFNISNDFFARQ
jgi:hypothetical protein